MKTKFALLLAGMLLGISTVNAQQQGPPPGQKPPSPEEHLKMVTTRLQKELTLTPEQKTKVEAAYKSFFAGMQKVRGNMPPPPPPPMAPGQKKSADSLSAIRDAQIKKVLTAAQFTKFKEVEKTMRPPRGPGQHQGPPPPPQAPSKQ